MKNFIEVLEKIGQTKSLQQVDSINQIYADLDCNKDAFKVMIAKANDTYCLLLPDDDDE
jgi:hypothetical protein